jgi:hypothetical protein
VGVRGGPKPAAPSLEERGQAGEIVPIRPDRVGRQMALQRQVLKEGLDHGVVDWIHVPPERLV